MFKRLKSTKTNRLCRQRVTACGRTHARRRPLCPPDAGQAQGGEPAPGLDPGARARGERRHLQRARRGRDAGLLVPEPGAPGAGPRDLARLQRHRPLERGAREPDRLAGPDEGRLQRPGRAAVVGREPARARVGRADPGLSRRPELLRGPGRGAGRGPGLPGGGGARGPGAQRRPRPRALAAGLRGRGGRRQDDHDRHRAVRRGRHRTARLSVPRGSRGVGAARAARAREGAARQVLPERDGPSRSGALADRGAGRAHGRRRSPAARAPEDEHRARRPGAELPHGLRRPGAAADPGDLAGRRGARAADRLHQRGQPAARAVGGAQPRAVAAHRTRSGTGARRAAAAHRGRPARGRGCRRSRCRSWGSPDACCARTCPRRSPASCPAGTSSAPTGAACSSACSWPSQPPSCSARSRPGARPVST